MARGSGTWPVNDCMPYCAAGTITPKRVALELFRRRERNGYTQYVALSVRPLTRGARDVRPSPSATCAGEARSEPPVARPVRSVS